MATTSEKRTRNHNKIRSTVAGTSTRPRLAVFKSNTAIYAQLIDDENGTTLASSNGTDAVKVGADIAKAGMAKSIDMVVFDRGGYVYTGKVKALADSAREAGLKF